MCDSGAKRPTASQLMQNAAKFNCGSFRNFEKNRGVVLDMLDKAEVQVAREEKKEKRAAERRSRNLFVKNLPFSVSSAQLREAFRPMGRVQSAKVMMTPAKESRGFGFVCLGTRAEAEAAQRAMDGRWVFGRQLHVSFAQAREERDAELQRRYGKPGKEVEDVKKGENLTVRSPKVEKNEDVVRRDVGEKPPSWGKSLTEREAGLANEKKEADQGVDDPMPWDPTPEDMAMLDDIFGEGVLIPPHLQGTSKAERRRNVPLSKKRGWNEDEENRARETSPRKLRKVVDWSSGQTLKASLKGLTIDELCEVRKDMTAGMELMVDRLGMGWTLVMDGVRKMTEEENLEKKKEKMDIDEAGIESPLDGIVGEKRDSSWETLPRNVLEKIEKHLSPAEKARFRTCNRQVMGNWWFWPRDRCSYIRWGIQIQREHNEYVGGIIREVRERDENYKAEKTRKREEKEAAQEARVPAAAAEYLRDNGKVPGAGYRSIARKYKITQQQLKDEVERLEEERIAAMYPSDDDDPYP